MTSTAPRPTQVTVAGWLVVVASVVVVVMAFSEVVSLRTLDTRNRIQEYLDSASGSTAGLTVDDVLTLVRVACTVSAVCAAATAVLGWYVLRRSRGSRLALSLISVPLVIAGLLSGGVVTGVVAVSAALLWRQPARAWFDGLSAPPVERPQAVRPAPPAGPPGGLDLPPPTSAPLYIPAPSGLQTSQRQTSQRPGTVVWACITTWLCTALVAVLLVLTSAVMLAEPSTLLDAAHQQNPDLASQGVSDHALEATVYVMTAVVVLWSVAAAVLAVLAWRRVSWAAIVLLASAAVAGLLCLLMLLGSVLMLLPAAACAATVVLLARPESRAWFRRVGATDGQ